MLIAETEHCRYLARKTDPLTRRNLIEVAEQYEAEARLISAYSGTHRPRRDGPLAGGPPPVTAPRPGVPMDWGDLPSLRQLDHVHGRGIPALLA